MTALGLVAVVVETGPETRYQPTVEMLERLDPAPDGLIVASPCNPAGTMLAPDELRALAVWCDGRGVRLISDEIYHGLHYTRPISTAAAFSDTAIVINSFSKYFSMTGWRVGWMVLPDDLVRPVECLAQNMFISAPHASQIAAEAAFGVWRGAGGERGAVSAVAGRVGKGLARGGVPVVRGGGWGVLRLCGCGGADNDSVALCARDAGGGGDRGKFGGGFRPGAGAPDDAVQLLRGEADVVKAVERLRGWR